MSRRTTNGFPKKGFFNSSSPPRGEDKGEGEDIAYPSSPHPSPASGRGGIKRNSIVVLFVCRDLIMSAYKETDFSVIPLPSGERMKVRGK
jgi:hypothetical protein